MRKKSMVRTMKPKRIKKDQLNNYRMMRTIMKEIKPTQEIIMTKN